MDLKNAALDEEVNQRSDLRKIIRKEMKSKPGCVTTAGCRIIESGMRCRALTKVQDKGSLQREEKEGLQITKEREGPSADAEESDKHKNLNRLLS